MIESLTIDDAGEVAGIHAATMSEGLLVMYRPSALAKVYSALIRAPESVSVGFRAGGALKGFAVASPARTQSLPFLIRHGHTGLIRDVAYVLLRHPVEVRRRWLSGTASGQHSAEVYNLYAISVAPYAQGEGIGRRLLDEVVRICSQRGVTLIRAESGQNQTAGHALYERAGWDLDPDTAIGPRPRCYAKVLRST
ncbi:GNAT family N-acetyltransferase [Euzebya rosea]|uniref:GNAT family N-acetyltransferase n=1 Tax=Euzebya rosea TaxID=2052804 RepID=UPI000D3E3A54